MLHHRSGGVTPGFDFEEPYGKWVVVDSEDRIVSAGFGYGSEWLAEGVVARYTSSGTPDEDFGTEGAVIIR
jgi:hypothetical protein